MKEDKLIKGKKKVDNHRAASGDIDDNRLFDTTSVIQNIAQEDGAPSQNPGK